MLNLRRWEAQNKPVSKDDFSETLHGSWRDIYEKRYEEAEAAASLFIAKPSNSIPVDATAYSNLGILLMKT
jgi:hypothetical protein